MQGLSVNKGTQIVELDELKTIPVPAPTKSYTQVSHFDLSNSIRTIGQDMLSDYNLIGEQYAVARQGQQLFAVLTFGAGHSEMGLSIGFRNSYDKSMSIGMTVGSQVFVCDNLMMTGAITVMKKHSANVLDTLEDVTINLGVMNDIKRKLLINTLNDLTDTQISRLVYYCLDCDINEISRHRKVSKQAVSQTLITIKNKITHDEDITTIQEALSNRGFLL